MTRNHAKHTGTKTTRRMGTIPVAGVAVAKDAIHPGMHSVDICCSMFVSVVEGLDPKDLLDTRHRITHFGPGGRQDQRFTLPSGLCARMEANSFLNNPRILLAAQAHLGTVRSFGQSFAFAAAHV